MKNCLFKNIIYSALLCGLIVCCIGLVGCERPVWTDPEVCPDGPDEPTDEEIEARRPKTCLDPGGYGACDSGASCSRDGCPQWGFVFGYMQECVDANDATKEYDRSKCEAKHGAGDCCHAIIYARDSDGQYYHCKDYDCYYDFPCTRITCAYRVSYNDSICP